MKRYQDTCVCVRRANRMLQFFYNFSLKTLILLIKERVADAILFFKVSPAP